MDELLDLQAWFEAVCNDDWEHTFGITIQTLDNPGWAVDIDLIGTPLEQINFMPTQVDRTGQDWVQCKVESGKFMGRGGVRNLKEILETFIAWAKKEASEPNREGGAG